MIHMVILVALLASAPAGAQEPASADDPFAGNACYECHRDLPGRSSEIVHVEWRESVHHAAGVSCDQCHGGHATLRRDQFDSDDDWKVASHARRDSEFLFLYGQRDAFVSQTRGRAVSYFCGKCHADIKEKHLGSPHGEFGDPTCLYCHGQGSHRITDPTLDLIDTRSRAEQGRCSPCHLASSMETLSRIKGMLVDIEERVDATGGLYRDLEAWGYRSLELEELHHHARSVRSRLRQVFHSFDMREINNFIGEIQVVVDRTVATHGLIDRLRRAKREQALVGALVAAMLLVFAGLLTYYKRSFLDHEPRLAAARR